MRAVVVVVAFELSEGDEEMVRVPDQCAVE
jgi:hypothetical protein